MPYLDLPDGRLYYEDTGTGAPVILFRGLGRSIRHWLGFDRRLARSHRVITIDARGVGRSTAPVGWDLTVFDLARDGFHVLDHLGIQRTHVMGISLGGMVTLAAGLLRPERTKTLTIVNSSIAGVGRMRLSLRGLGSMLYGCLSPGQLEQRLTGVLINADRDGLHDRVSRANAEIRRIEGTPYDTIAKQLIAALRFKATPRLETLRIPALVLYGTDDRFVPTKNSHVINELLPCATMEAIRGGGHELTVDHQEEVVAAMRRFFRSQDVRSKPVVPRRRRAGQSTAPFMPSP